MQFLETLLLPEFHEHHPFVFFKVINVDENPFADDMPIKSITLTPKKNYSPVIAKVAHIDIYDDELMFTVKSDDEPTLYTVSTRKYYIMENDEIEGVRNTNLEIGDAAENQLIQLMKQYPSIKKKIPQELKDHPSFKRKVELERTKGRIKSTNRTGTINHPKLSDLEQKLINDMLDVKTDPHTARREQTRRIAPQENARDGYFSSFRRMFSMPGGKRNRTRRFKK